MAEDTSVAVPETGNEAEQQPAEQETNQATQVVEKPQSVSTPQVESSDNKPQTSEQSRPYEGLFRSERKRIRRLEETIQQLNKKLDTSKIDVPKDEPLDHSALFQEPDKYLSQREQKLMKEINALREEVTGWKVNQEMQAKERRGLEALEKLFPKTSADSKETLEERVNKDPERAERLKEFFNLPHIKAMAEVDPDEAAAYAIEKLGLNPKPNPLVLKKSAMGGTTTGNPGSKSLSENDLLSEKRKLDEMLDKNPSLRNDDNFRKRKAQVISSLTRLVTEKRK